jgi:hypothetical protein
MMRAWLSKKVPEVVRREASAAVPAAMRAASHAGKEFLKKFSEEFRTLLANTPLTLKVVARP